MAPNCSRNICCSQITDCNHKRWEEWPPGLFPLSAEEHLQYNKSTSNITGRVCVSTGHFLCSKVTAEVFVVVHRVNPCVFLPTKQEFYFHRSSQPVINHNVHAAGQTQLCFALNNPPERDFWGTFYDVYQPWGWFSHFVVPGLEWIAQYDVHNKIILEIECAEACFKYSFYLSHVDKALRIYLIPV